MTQHNLLNPKNTKSLKKRKKFLNQRSVKKVMLAVF